MEYLHLWGHYRLLIDLQERLQEKISDKQLARISVGNLGVAYDDIGKTMLAIGYKEKALAMARESKNRQAEETWLGNLASSYANLGDMRKAIDFREQALVIDQEIGDRRGEGIDLCSLGNAYVNLGNVRKAIELYEQALVVSREIDNRRGESAALSGIAVCYGKSGQIIKAIEYQKDVLTIAQEIGDRTKEGVCLSNLGSYYSNLNNQEQAKGYFEKSLVIAQETGYRYGEGFRLLNLVGIEIEFKNYKRAIDLALQSTKIGDEISRPHLQSHSYMNLALAGLLSENIKMAKVNVETATKYDVPENNHNASVLHGIILLRQGNTSAARQAFTRAIAQADEILAKTLEYYDALDAKGLALCGLILCRGAVPAPNDTANTGQGNPAPTVDEAIETFRAARKIAPHAGIVKRNLRLFDELAKCDTEGLLEGVREAVEGVDG